MSFGQSAPPASAKQVQYLLALAQKAGHATFREARGPLGLTQRQAGGKFSKVEASALIDRLLAENGDGDGEGDGGVSGEQISAADILAGERAELLRGMPAGLLVAELERRGWLATPPT